MTIISAKTYYSKYRTRTWGSAPPPFYQHMKIVGQLLQHIYRTIIVPFLQKIELTVLHTEARLIIVHLINGIMLNKPRNTLVIGSGPSYLRGSIHPVAL